MLRAWVIAAMFFNSMPSWGAQPSAQVWYLPDNDTPDLTDLFSFPEKWAAVRSRIAVFDFGPQQVRGEVKPAAMNTSIDLARVNAFQLLHSWGIKIAISAPAVKEWDCSGVNAAKLTLSFIDKVRQAGGATDILNLDEPLISGILRCDDTIEAVAKKVSNYALTVRSQAPGIEIGDIEGYPTFSVSQIEEFVTALQSNGMKLSFFQLDVNIPVLAVRQGIDLDGDLQRLLRFFREKTIPFGVIVWAGYNPVHSDRAYYDESMAWVRRIKKAIGEPDQIVFASWVTRSSEQCVDGKSGCSIKNLECTPADPPYCGKKSVPLNLGRYGLTGLVNDGMTVFEER